MFKLLLVVSCVLAASLAAPAPGVLAYSAPLVAAPLAAPLATSHQVIARNYNAVHYAAPAAAYVAAPALAARVVSPYAAYNPYVAAPALYL